MPAVNYVVTVVAIGSLQTTLRALDVAGKTITTVISAGHGKAAVVSHD